MTGAGASDSCEWLEIDPQASTGGAGNAFERTGLAGISISPTGTAANEATAMAVERELHAS